MTGWGNGLASVWIGAAALGFIAWPAVATTTQPPPAVTSVEEEGAAASRALLSGAYLDMKAEDAASALPKLRRAIAMKGFAELRDSERRTAYAAFGWTAMIGGNLREAHDAYVKATNLPESEAPEWSGRLSTAAELKDHEDAVAALTGYAVRWPKGLQRFQDSGVRTVVAWAARPEADRDREMALLNALFDAGWSAADVSTDSQWSDLAVLLVEHGAKNRAGAVLERITDPGILVKLRSDRRFDEFVAARPALADPDGAMAAYIDARRADAQAHPRKLGRVRTLAHAVMLAGRWTEALDLVDSAITRATDVAGPAAFDDAQDELNWIMEKKATALMGLGRWPEALDTMVHASHRTQGGGENVSQALHLGRLYVSLGRAREALDAVEDVDRLSAFGRMQRELVRFRAHLLLGDAAAAAKSLAYLKANEADGPEDYLAAVVYAGDFVEAERLIVLRLRDPYARGRMLLSLQRGLDTPRTAADAPYVKAWRSLADRPAIASVVAQVGRVASYRMVLD